MTQFHTFKPNAPINYRWMYPISINDHQKEGNGASSSKGITLRVTYWLFFFGQEPIGYFKIEKSLRADQMSLCVIVP